MVIPETTLKRELIPAAICLVDAILLNVYAIIHYGGGWGEVFTQIGYTVIIAAILYVAVTALRLLVWLILSIAGKIRKRRLPIAK